MQIKGEGGLLTICSSRVGAYSRKGVFFEGGQFEDLRYFTYFMLYCFQSAFKTCLFTSLQSMAVFDVAVLVFHIETSFCQLFYLSHAKRSFL